MLLNWLLIIVFLLILTYFLKVINKLNYWKYRNVKYPKTFNIFGNIWQNILQRKSLCYVIDDCYKQFKNEPYFGIFTFLTPTLVVTDPELIKDLTIKNINNFIIHKIFNSSDANQTYSKNLFATTGDKWKAVRPSLTPAFTSKKIRSLYPLISKCVMQCIDNYKTNSANLIKVDLKTDLFEPYTTDIIINCIFGLESNSFIQRDNNEIFERIKNISRFFGLKLFVLFGYCMPKFMFKIFDMRIISKSNEEFFTQLVLETIRLRTIEGNRREDLLQMLLDAKNGAKYESVSSNDKDTGYATYVESDIGKNTSAACEISESDIVGHSMLFMIAGTDTTAIASTRLVYELCKNPDIQERLYNEIESVMKECNENITPNMLLDMPYLDMCVSEVLRKWPPLPVLDRCNIQPHTIKVDDRELHLEADSVVWIPVYSIHHDPKYYPDPEVFNPERFHKNNLKNIKCYMPFGMGPRSCLGTRLAIIMIKAVFVNLMYHFEFVPIPETPEKYEAGKSHIFLNSDEKIWVGLKKRR